MAFVRLSGLTRSSTKYKAKFAIPNRVRFIFVNLITYTFPMNRKYYIVGAVHGNKEKRFLYWCKR